MYQKRGAATAAAPETRKGPELVGGVKLAAIAKNGNEYVQTYINLTKLGIGEGVLFLNGKFNPDGQTIRLFLPDDMSKAIKSDEAPKAATSARTAIKKTETPF